MNRLRKMSAHVGWMFIEPAVIASGLITRATTVVGRVGTVRIRVPGTVPMPGVVNRGPQSTVVSGQHSEPPLLRIGQFRWH